MIRKYLRKINIMNKKKKKKIKCRKVVKEIELIY